MNIFPAIDLKDGNVVRLLRGDYDKLTVYSQNPLDTAKKFESCGAGFLHTVDLDGAKSGTVFNYKTVESICKSTSLKVEIGGGIRNEETIKQYISAGAFRVILGTIAVENPDFTEEMVAKYGDKIAVGVDILSSMVAVRGWREISTVSCDEIFEKLCKIGTKTVICTDISKDGAMQGTNLELYKSLSDKYKIDIVASGGISTIDDVSALKKMGLYGAILGKSLYTGAIDLKTAIEVAK